MNWQDKNGNLFPVKRIPIRLPEPTWEQFTNKITATRRINSGYSAQKFFEQKIKEFIASTKEAE